MRNLFLALALVLTLSGCTNKTQAERLLEAQGYENIKMTGYAWFACSEDDFFSTGFMATTANGSFVSGAVCSGLFFKGATIRFNS